MVEVFKTNVQWVNEAEDLIQKLLEHFPHYIMNFDLEDCDKILRVEGEDIFASKIIKYLNEYKYTCEILE